MKLEIELDINKIDYDAINKQIAEKVATLNIKDEYDIESKIDRKISNLVSDEVDNHYNRYLDGYWSGVPSEGKKLIESMTKDEIERRTKLALEKVFDDEYSADKIREVALKVIPDVFGAVLFKKMENNLFSAEYSYYDRTHRMVMSEIANAINQVKYNL